MAELCFVAHLPLLRIEPEHFDCGEFKLWRMPFEVFDNLSQGAFSDHRSAYEVTAPVFLRLDMNFDATSDGFVRPLRAARAVPEIKVPSANWAFLKRLGLGIVLNLHELIDRHSSALALAAPASLLPRSRWSVTFAQVDEAHAFVLPGREPAGSFRVQGDADMEYLFAPACAGPPLDEDTLARAAQWQGMVDFIAGQPDLAAALQALRDAASPTLEPAEQELLCSVALEALLLPEVRSGLAETFARRAANLPGAQDVARLRAAAALLYDARSAGLHGAALAPDAQAAIASARAAQWLAAAIVALAHRLKDGAVLDELRLSLDADTLVAAAPAPGSTPPARGGVPRWSLSSDPPGLRREHRISPPVMRHPFISRSSSAGLQGVEGAYALYAPLAGLGCTALQPLGEPPCPGIIPLTGSEVVSLEDKDIARDYLSELHLIPERIAALALYMPDAALGDEHEALRRLRQVRNTAVASLRLAGFDRFIDPELAGLHVIHGSRPLREPSVLRQTVLARLRAEPERMLAAADRALTAPMWELLQRYAHSTRHPEIERWLAAFRRAHDREFLPPLARANLGFALVEGLLGRFRAPADPLPLELLVERVLGGADPAAAQWFAAQARGWRNALAHGRLTTLADDAAPPQHLLAIARGALARAVTLWLDKGDANARPAKLLIRELSKP